MELLVGDLDGLIKEVSTACHVESVGMLHFYVDFIQILVPGEGRSHFDWRFLLVQYALQHGRVFVLHNQAGVFDLINCAVYLIAFLKRVDREDC